MTDLRPGMFGVVDVKGPGGWWIKLGQALAGDASRYAHAFLILNADGTILEAEPGGARLANISEYQGCGMLLSDAPVQAVITPGRQSLIPPGGHDYESNEPQVRASIVTEARKLVGVPYSALDYFALALLHLHLPSKWVQQRVESSGHLICSALVDRVYMNAGIHLFDDKPYRLRPEQPRYVGDVMPSDLAAYAEDQGK